MEVQTIINNNTIESPVIFYDGEREIDLGKVQITLSMTFKLLQSTLSNKIGISPNHITIYLDRHNNNNNNNFNHNRRRHPVTSKFEFASLEVGSCFFWVVLKRGRRNRRRRKVINNTNNNMGNVPIVLLRRGVNDFNDWDYMDYVNKLRMMEEIEKERYFMSLNLNSNVYNELSGYNYGGFNVNDHHSEDYYLSRSSGDDFEYDHDQVEFGSCSSSVSERVFCEVCCSSMIIGETVPFHWCKNDVVVATGTRTRSLVGPIAPPLKNSILG